MKESKFKHYLILALCDTLIIIGAIIFATSLYLMFDF